jgi:hypothetical protein
MFQLNEGSMKRIMREEYMKRLKQFLAEEIDIEYKVNGQSVNTITDAAGLKVREDKTGFEYVIDHVDSAAGNIILTLPDVPRIMQANSTSKLTEADIDGDGISDEIDDDIDMIKQGLKDPVEEKKRKVSVDKFNLINYQDNKLSNNNNYINNKNYIVVPIEEFIKNYSL